MIDIVTRVFLRVSTKNISLGKIARVTRKFTRFFQREQQCGPRHTEKKFQSNGIVNDAWKQLSFFEFSVLNRNDLSLFIFAMI